MPTAPKESHRISIPALAVLAVLALFIAGPVIAFPYYAGDRYHGINIAHFGNDEHFYLSRAKEVLDGHGLGQPFLAEGKDLPDSFQSNIEQVILFPITVLGLGEHVNVVTLYNIFNGLGVFLLLVLIYFFVYELSSDVLLSLACATFAIGGYFLIENGTIIATLIRTHTFFYDNFNIFGRSADPYTALIPFFGFLILTHKAVRSQFRTFSRENFAPYGYVLGAGTLLGFLFYDYFYAWTFALAFLGSLSLSSLLWRKWQGTFAAVGIAAVGALIGSFKLVSFYQFYSSSMGAQVTYFMLATRSHALIASTTGAATVLLFGLYLYMRRNDENNFFLLAIITAGWVALEQQVITGRVVQYGHFYWYFVVPLSIIVGIYMLARLIPKDQQRRWVCAVIIALALVTTAGGQYRSFPTTLPGKMREQDFAPIIQKLQESQPGVVLAGPGGESYPFLVTIYTDDDLYWLTGATTSAFPIDHFKEALLVYLYLNKDSTHDPVAYLEKTLAGSTPNTYTEMYDELEAYTSGIPLKTYSGQFPQNNPTILAARKTFLPSIGVAYKALTSKPGNVRATLQSRGVRYILWDRRIYPEWDPSVMGPLSILATSTDVTLYSFATSTIR